MILGLSSNGDVLCHVVAQNISKNLFPPAPAGARTGRGGPLLLENYLRR